MSCWIQARVAWIMKKKRVQGMLPPNGGNGFRQPAWEGLLRLIGGLGCQFNGGLTR